MTSILKVDELQDTSGNLIIKEVEYYYCSGVRQSTRFGPDMEQLLQIMVSNRTGALNQYSSWNA